MREISANISASRASSSWCEGKPTQHVQFLSTIFGLQPELGKNAEYLCEYLRGKGCDIVKRLRLLLVCEGLTQEIISDVEYSVMET